MNAHEPLPPHLERLGAQLVAAASARGTATRRHWRPTRAALITAIGVMATGGAAAAAVPALISTNDHHLFTPNGQDTEQPIDRCSQTADGKFEFCTSAVGTTFQVKNANDQFVDPSACTEKAQLETCDKPYHFTLDLSNPSQPVVVGSVR